jgi:hypothetical protein
MRFIAIESDVLTAVTKSKLQIEKELGAFRIFHTSIILHTEFRL